jgi:hypothetical protein
MRRLLPFFVSAFFGLSLVGGCFGGAGGGAPGALGGMSGPAGTSTSGMAASMGGSDVTLAGSSDDDAATSGPDDSAPAERRSQDPTAGADTPVTVVGNPSAFTPKNPPCLGIREIHICFGQVRVAVDGAEDSLGRLPYRVSGGLYAKINGEASKLIVSPWLIEIFDLLHPEAPVGKASTEASGFDVVLNAAVGRPLRFQEKFCGRVVRLDFATPDPAASPLLLDPCGTASDTDEADPDWEGYDVPPPLPPVGTLPVDPIPPREIVPLPDPDEGLHTPKEWEPRHPRIDEDRHYRPLGPDFWN